MMSPSVAAGASPTAEDPVEVHFFSRTDALQHVRKLDQASDEGVWMPATTAKSSVSRPERSQSDWEPRRGRFGADAGNSRALRLGR